MLEQKQRKQQVLHTLNQRLYENVRKQANKETREAEKKVSTFVGKGADLTANDIEQEFPSIDSEITNLAVTICHEPSSVKGHELSHLWFDMDKCQWDLYCGSICAFKSTKKTQKYTIEYWLPGCPEDSHKTPLTVTQLVSDLILGDLVFT